MKAYYLILLFTCFTLSLAAQDRKFNVGLDMSLSLSATTRKFGNAADYGMRFSQNLFVKSGYYVTRNMEVTAGFGLLTTRQFEAIEFIPDIDRIELDHSHRYLVIPFGIKYHFGSFYVHPEIGIGADAGHPTRQYTFTTTMGPTFNLNSVIVQQFNASDHFFGYRDYSLPLFLTLGSEFDLGVVSMILGVKGYYSLSTLKESQFGPPEHYYGVGVVTGVKF